MSMPVIPSVPPSGAGAVSGVGSTASSPSPQLEVADPGETSRMPAADHLLAFGQAVAHSHAHQLQAALPPGDGPGTTLMHQIDQLTQQMGSLQNGPAPASSTIPAPDSPHPGSAHAGPAGPGAATIGSNTMDAAVGQMEHAYMLAIETTMASRGSTESTKIFNTLLKGQ